MDIRKLEAFCKVYELQSFSKAGDELFLSQPTISSHVANLEVELGVKLFDRMGRKVMATEAGNVLYKRVVTIFENLEQARASIEMLRDKVVGELVVGCSTIPSHNIMPDLLNGFVKKYPDVSFTIHTSDSSEVIRRVADGEWPMGIVGQEPEIDGVISELILEDEIAFVASPNTDWTPQGHDPITMKTLAGLPWVMRARGSGTRYMMEQGLAKIGKTLKDLNIRCRVETTCEALAHTISGVGVCVTSRVVSDEFVQRGELVRLRVPELEGKRRFYLIYHNDKHMFPAMKTFIDYTRSVQLKVKR